jgi:hypothetical protein
MNDLVNGQSDSTVGQKFQYELEKETAKRGITFEYSADAGEHLRVEMAEGMPVIVANQAGMLALARLLLTVGARRRSAGLQLFLREDFDSDRKKILRILLEEEQQSLAPVPGEEKHASAA